VAASVLGETGGDVLELGAGSGRLALDVLLELERLGRPADSATGYSKSAPTCASASRHLIAERGGPSPGPGRMAGQPCPPVSRGMILGNEVLDALPAHLVHWRDGVAMERGVVWREGGFAWEDSSTAASDEFGANGLGLAGRGRLPVGNLPGGLRPGGQPGGMPGAGAS
jgi:hypothetical protein